MNHIARIRQNIDALWHKAASERDFGLVLDIAPQDHGGVKNLFSNAKVLTLDIDPNLNPDYVADLCKTIHVVDHDLIAEFNTIICTEVLEHVLEPQAAANNLLKMLVEDGVVYGSTPFDLGIHPPFPDMWRFTEDGLRHLFRNFSKVEISPLINEHRQSMPIHYTWILTK